MMELKDKNICWRLLARIMAMGLVVLLITGALPPVQLLAADGLAATQVEEPNPGDEGDDGDPDPVEATGIYITREAVTIKKGKKLTLKVGMLPAEAEALPVVWKSSRPKVAKVGRNSGQVVARKNGKTTITATTKDGRFTAKCVVYVGTPVKKIKLNRTQRTVRQGKSFRLKVKVTPTKATLKTVRWTSSNEAVATVAADGRVTTHAPGQAVITAKSLDRGKTSSCTVTVRPGVEDVSISAAASTLMIGGKLRLRATVIPANAYDSSVTWTSSDRNIARVSRNGVVTGKGAGTVRITVTTNDGKKTASCLITVQNRIFKGRNRVTSGYRLPARPSHNGIDIVGMDDTTIYATISGRVRYARIVAKDAPGWGRTWEWGYFVWIEGDDGRHHIYAHMKKQPAVKEGSRVEVGDKLGIMGNTGYSFGAHVHYEVRRADGRTTVNPAPFAGLKNSVGIYD